MIPPAASRFSVGLALGVTVLLVIVAALNVFPSIEAPRVVKLPKRREPSTACLGGRRDECPAAPDEGMPGARRWPADTLPVQLAALDDAIARATSSPIAAIDARALPVLPAGSDAADARASLAQQIVDFFEYGSRPFVAIPAYWNASATAALRAEVLRFQSLGCAEPGEGADMRTFECERYSELARTMRDDALVADVARKYLGIEPDKPFKLHTVLAGHVAHTPGKLVASGGGWHRDAAFKGIKSMLYLEEVHRDNGPFTMLLNYDDALFAELWDRADPKGRRSRFNDSVVHDALTARAQDAATQPGLPVPTALEILGAPGTLVIFLTHNIHRGKVIEQGERTSITTYYNVGPPPGSAKYRNCKARRRA
mmetsp:Transcript_13869/g.35953  ORF Transcript_13869/g.35953 Transcript_13869/m.35953 type:complete len:369 (+) Transcript_13869:41-1147(+)